MAMRNKGREAKRREKRRMECGLVCVRSELIGPRNEADRHWPTWRKNNAILFLAIVRPFLGGAKAQLS